MILKSSQIDTINKYGATNIFVDVLLIQKQNAKCVVGSEGTEPLSRHVISA